MLVKYVDSIRGTEVEKPLDSFLDNVLDGNPKLVENALISLICVLTEKGVLSATDVLDVVNVPGLPDYVMMSECSLDDALGD